MELRGGRERDGGIPPAEAKDSGSCVPDALNEEERIGHVKGWGHGDGWMPLAEWPCICVEVCRGWEFIF